MAKIVETVPGPVTLWSPARNRGAVKAWKLAGSHPRGFLLIPTVFLMEDDLEDRNIAVYQIAPLFIRFADRTAAIRGTAASLMMATFMLAPSSG